jgi:hypothetical protein
MVLMVGFVTFFTVKQKTDGFNPDEIRATEISLGQRDNFRGFRPKKSYPFSASNFFSFELSALSLELSALLPLTFHLSHLTFHLFPLCPMRHANSSPPI